jgi:hypothetical protein
MIGPSEGKDVGRVVGADDIASLVANSCCVTTLKPASSDEATSPGRAASNTERAFCEASTRPEADMVGVCAFDRRDVSLDDVVACSKAMRSFSGPAVNWVMVEVVAGRNRSVPVGRWEDNTLACLESRPLDPPGTRSKGWAPNTEHDCGSTRTHGRLLAKVVAPLGWAVCKADCSSMREGSPVLCVCEYLSVSDTRVACDVIADVRNMFCALSEEDTTVVFHLSTCDLSVPTICHVGGYVQYIARALTNTLKWTPNRKMDPIICSMLRAIA